MYALKFFAKKKLALMPVLGVPELTGNATGVFYGEESP
jgi:hypothetical protein